MHGLNGQSPNAMSGLLVTAQRPNPPTAAVAENSELLLAFYYLEPLRLPDISQGRGLMNR